MPEPPVLLADTITRLPPDAAGAVVVSGSHGGVFPAWAARTAGCRAVILHDAGIGLDRAGIAGLAWADAVGMAAVAIDGTTAPIGDASACRDRGLVSRANRAATAVGVVPGQSCREAARRLASAPLPQGPVPEVAEARRVLTPEGARRRLVLVDSASLVRPEDAGAVVVTGSHGALFGGDPANALKADARLALFNDAGQDHGTTRLPALETRGIAAATVAAASARIGEAASTWTDGRLSSLNARARAFGLREGDPARDLVAAALA